MRTFKNSIKSICGFLFWCKAVIRMIRKENLLGTYRELNFVRYFSNKKFIEVKKYNDQTNKVMISGNDHITVGFVLYTSSIWNLEELYQILKKDDRFDIDLILVHIKMQDDKSADDTFAQTFEYFRKNSYSIKKAADVNVFEYNILFFLTIGNIMEKNVRIDSIPLNTIVLYTSYSYMLSDVPEKMYSVLYHVAYRYYTDSEYYKRLIEKVECYTGNARYVGFPKMDQYYSAVYKRRSEKKIIIYAPHHSVHRTEILRSSTFDMNYRTMLNLAKKYSEDTYWIFKPHPSLRSNSVVAGIFNSLEEYDAYENEWATLDNADVVSTGEYFSIFKESDAMITDSVSFLAEYQFTHKPLLHLESGKTAFNDFGNLVLDILYRCQGNDIYSIEKFVKNIIDGEDEMKDRRDEFFDNYLEYMHDGISASTRIHTDLLNIIR